MKYSILILFLSLFTAELFSQQVTVTGEVKGTERESLPGVNIVEKGTTNGTVTDLEGNFSLSLSSAEPEIMLSYLGYVTQEIAIRDKTEFNIILNEELMDLEEVVVVGYGTAKKSDLTGAISSVKPNELNVSGISNAAQMLQGRVTGLYISSANQNPGSTPAFILRGAASFQEGEAGQPLIVIDGFPMDDASYINTVNPSDIAQIDVLKDASATAIYGSRGANGVIIITTKQGNKQGIQVDYSAKFYTQTGARTVDMMDGQQYARFYYDLAHDPSLQLGDWGPDNGYPHPFGTWETLPNTDWQKEVINNGNFTTEQNLALSGIREGVKYRAAANYYNGDGIISPSDYKRINTLARLDYDYKKFSFNININYTNENRNTVLNSFERSLGFSPSSPVYDSLGNLSVHAFEPNASWYYNPLFPSEAEDRFSETNTTRISVGLEYEFIPGLRASVKGGITQNSIEDFYQRFKPLYESQKRPRPASAQATAGKSMLTTSFNIPNRSRIINFPSWQEDHTRTSETGGTGHHRSISPIQILATIISMQDCWSDRWAAAGMKGRLCRDLQGSIMTIKAGTS